MAGLNKEPKTTFLTSVGLSRWTMNSRSFPHFRLLALASLFLLAELSLLLDMREAALAAIGAILSLSSTPRPAP